MKRLYISDLHLEQEQPTLTQAFVELIEYWKNHINELYILGDLFNFWIGDDFQNECTRRVADTLRPLPFCGWMYGNRDFLLGESYMQQAGLTPLSPFHTISMGAHRAILCHGDELCTQDHYHQAQRAKYLNPEFQQAFLAKSLDKRIAYAKHLRAQSTQHTASLHTQIMDVDLQTVADTMNQHDADVLIHGHTHRPAIHNCHNQWRVVLGDWHTTHGWYAIETAAKDTATRVPAVLSNNTSLLQLVRFPIPFTPHDQHIVATISQPYPTP